MNETRRFSSRFAVALAAVGLLLALARSPSADADDSSAKPAKRPVEKTQQALLFETDVLPILRSRCLRCHGEKSRKAQLDLRTSSAIFKGGEAGPAVVAGNPKKSVLFEMIHDGAMPPKGGRSRSADDRPVDVQRASRAPA